MMDGVVHPEVMWFHIHAGSHRAEPFSPAAHAQWFHAQ
jgi:hypothetical protein